MREETRQKFIQLAEPSYKEFSAALIPGETTMLGIRLPQLRKIAKEIAAGNWQEELRQQDICFEEVMLRGMIISYATLAMNPEEALPYIEEFIPCVKNWSVCDSVFMKMDVLQKDRDRTWEFIRPYLKSGDEFKVRVALIIMMQHLLKCDNKGRKIARVRHISMKDLQNSEEERRRSGKYLEGIFRALNRPFKEGYYAHMAAAWLIAEAYCCFPATTHTFLLREDGGLDNATYNKALQKITESRIPSGEVKAYIRSMKKPVTS